MAVYMYFHLRLHSFWTNLSKLPTVFPDGVPLDVRVYPWILTTLVYSYVGHMKPYTPPYARLLKLTSVLSAWFMVPLTVAVFWFRYISARDAIGNLWLLLMVSVGMYFCLTTFRLARESLGFPWRTKVLYQAIPSTNSVHSRRLPWPRLRELLVTLLVAACGYLLSHMAITTPDWGLGERPLALLRLVPNLQNAQLSTRTQEYFQGREDRDRQTIAVVGVQMRGRNLRYVNCRGAFMAGGDLGKADLRQAHLERADLRVVNLRGAFV